MRIIRVIVFLSLSFGLSLFKQAFASEYDVIVVGAGMSGIAAAHDLQLQGMRVLVIEARDRIGGRIWSDKLAGKVVDLGAGWIQEIQGNPLTALVRKYQIKTKSYDYYNNIIYDADGKPLAAAEVQHIDKLAEDFKHYLEKQQEQAGDDASVADVLHRYNKFKQLSQRDAYYLQFVVTNTIQYEYAGDLKQVSMMEYDQDSGFAGEDWVFPAGYDQLVQALAKGLNIRLNEAVTDIDYTDAPIKVTTKQAIYQARFVVCTLPLGVLQQGSVHFHPKLPGEKQKAIRHLAMGTLDRVYLQFEKVFWDPSRDEFAYIPANHTRWMEIVNLYKINQNPALAAFIAGDEAVAMESKTDKEVINDLMATYKLIWGNNIPEPIHYKITRWHQDPYSRGSYSYIPVNSDGHYYEVLAEPIDGRLFFAGEATSKKYPATVHGAYLSGLQAASEIHFFEND